MRKGAGLDVAAGGANLVGDSLDHLIGTWSDEEAVQVMQAVADFEVIDDELWR